MATIDEKSGGRLIKYFPSWVYCTIKLDHNIGLSCALIETPPSLKASLAENSYPSVNEMISSLNNPLTEGLRSN